MTEATLRTSDGHALPSALNPVRGCSRVAVNVTSASSGAGEDRMVGCHYQPWIETR
jgi:hypothetical protein